MLLYPCYGEKFMYYMLSIGLKTKIDFGLGFAPNLTGLAYTAPPDLLDGGQEVSYPSPRT